MGLFRNKKVAEENEFEGATEWFKAQAKTAETFNNEDKDMEGQDTPKQARTARGFIQGTHPCHSSQAETCQEHQRNDKGDAKRTERGNRTLNKHFVKAA